MPQGTSIIIKFEESTEQTVGSITKIVGLVPARFFVSIIDSLNLRSKSQILKDRRSHRCNSGDDQQQSPAFSVYEQGRAAGFFQLRKA